MLENVGVAEYIRISIHTLCEEGDANNKSISFSFIIFQSTPSVKRATGVTEKKVSSHAFQSTPSVKRATGKSINFRGLTLDFNPHPL